MEQNTSLPELPSKPRMLQTLKAFNHLVEIKTVNRWIGAFILGFYFYVKSFSISFNFFSFLMSLLGIFLILCYVMTINDCFDVEDDKIKSRLTGKELVVSEEISVKSALVLSIVMLVSGLVISFVVSQSFVIIIFLIIMLSTLYSVPPVRYKRIFPLGTMGEFMGAFLPFLSGYAVQSPSDLKALIVSAFFALITMYWRFYHETIFVTVDRLTGKRTFAVVFGPKISRALSRVCLLVALIEVTTLFILDWFTIEFLFLLGTYLLFTFGFWYYLNKYIPKSLEDAIGPAWGLAFVTAVVILLLT